MHRYASVLFSVLIIVGLTLPSGLEAAPFAAGGNQSWRAAPTGGLESTDGRSCSRKRAKTKQDRRQTRRDNASQKRKKDHKQAERKKDAKERKQDRKDSRVQSGGQAVELSSGRLPAAETVAPGSAAPLSAEDRYIVVLEEDAGDSLQAANAMATQAAGVVPTHVYDQVFNGFAAVIPDNQLDAIRSDPRVKAVVPDAEVTIVAQPVPPGIARINADQHGTARIDGIDERVDIDVAVLDTAGNDSHPDLNVWAFANCTDSPNNLADQGHGTHVGGTIGALDNNIGVVGVAPGARLWNFRVLKANPGGGATGLNSWIICGLDLVTLHATAQGRLGDIEVANASLGGPGTDTNCQSDFDPYHLAYCRAVAAGVTVVVAAGNSAQNAANFVPATYAEVITVSALADSDGRPGGLGRATSAGADDTLATLSNFGGDINIAAPGVDILSTVPTGSCDHCNPSGYGQLSGTSMASPHVAGAAALYIATHPNASPAEVKNEILNSREVVALPNDRDGFNEGVLRVADDPEPLPPPPPTVDPGPGIDDSSFVSTNTKNDKKKHKKKHKKKKH